MLNRSVLIVRAKEPFREWLRSLPDPTDLPLAELNEDPNAYLLPDCDDHSAGEDILADFCDLIFEQELAGWWTVKADWPQKRDLATFKRWFDCQFSTVVVDLVEEPIDDDERE